jgi:hypothetical protein
LTNTVTGNKGHSVLATILLGVNLLYRYITDHKNEKSVS